MLNRIFGELKEVDVPWPIPRISFDEAMWRYGVDNPDVRFEMELNDFTDVVKNSPFKVFSGPAGDGGLVLGIIVSGGAQMSRKEIDGLTEFVKTYGAGGLAWLKRAGSGFTGPVAKFVDDGLKTALLENAGMQDGDLGLIVADKNPATARTAAGRLRAHLGQQRLVKPDQFGFIWIEDFPMFEKDEETGRISAMHHPFTAPHLQDLDKLETDPLSVRARAYDVVVNGQEVGGGSIRIHDQGIQARVFKALGIGDEEANNKFGFLLDALSYGAPPHGGIAFGFDRLIAILAGTDSIRDVIAFPKTTRAACLMTNAPSEVDQDQLAELGLSRLKK
jgi:aspartyl-tRNA synthetase